MSIRNYLSVILFVRFAYSLSIGIVILFAPVSLFCLVRDLQITVGSPAGKIRVGKNSSVLLEVRGNGRTRVVSLSGENSVEGDKGSTGLKLGDELLATSADLGDAEFVPADGIARGEAVEAAITKSGKTIKRQIVLREVIEREIVIGGSRVRVGARNRSMHKRYREHIRAAADQQPQFKPISFIAAENKPRPGEQSNREAKPSSTTFFQLVGAPKTDVRALDAKNILLRSGSIVFVAPLDMQVRTGIGSILVPKGECINVEVSERSMKVRACSGVNSVTVKLSDQVMPLSAGQELIVSAEKPSNDALDDKLSRRDTQVVRWGNAWISRSDFSIVSLLNTTSYMRAIARATNETNKSVQAKMLKTAAALQLATGSHGPYRPRQPLSMK